MKIIKENKNNEKTYQNKKFISTTDHFKDKLIDEDPLLPSKLEFEDIYKENIFLNSNSINNSNICYQFGQVNLEKALFILVFQMIITASAIYFYIDLIDELILYLYLITAGIDFVITIIYIYFIKKFIQDAIISNFSRSLSNLVDIINSFNILLKCINVGILFLKTDKLTFFLVFWFMIKFVLDIYFVFSTLRIFLFCSFAIWLNEKLYIFTNWVKYYLFCFHLEEKDFAKHDKFEQLVSNY